MLIASVMGCTEGPPAVVLPTHDFDLVFLADVGTSVTIDIGLYGTTTGSSLDARTCATRAIQVAGSGAPTSVDLDAILEAIVGPIAGVAGLVIVSLTAAPETSNLTFELLRDGQRIHAVAGSGGFTVGNIKYGILGVPCFS